MTFRLTVVLAVGDELLNPVSWNSTTGCGSPREDSLTLWNVPPEMCLAGCRVTEQRDGIPLPQTSTRYRTHCRRPTGARQIPFFSNKSITWRPRRKGSQAQISITQWGSTGAGATLSPKPPEPPIPVRQAGPQNNKPTNTKTEICPVCLHMPTER